MRDKVRIIYLVLDHSRWVLEGVCQERLRDGLRFEDVFLEYITDLQEE